MKYQNDIVSTIKEHRSLFIIIMVGLFLIELEIFAVAAMKSGRKSMRYLLARKSIESHKEVEKYRLRLEYEQNQTRQIE
jgi:hypothetical protein